MNIDYEEILLEWSYRLPKGFPTIVDGKFGDRDEVIILNQILEERGLQPIEVPENVVLETVGMGGVQYEQKIVAAIRTAKVPGLVLKDDGKATAAFSNVGAGDIEATYNGKPFNIEVKMSPNDQMGRGSLRYDLETKKFTPAKDVDPADLELLLSAVNQKKDALDNYILAARKLKPIKYHRNISGIPLTVSKQGRDILKSKGYLKAINTTIVTEADFIVKHYNKKGVFYIQIGGAGLFYLGKNPLRLPVPKLDGEIQIEIRLAYAGGGGKFPDGTENRTAGLRFQGRLRTKNTSPYTLDNSKSIKAMFSQTNLNEAGTSAERQESGFVNLINQSVKKNGGKPITLVTTDNTVKGVTGAKKYTGRAESGSEPYTDVVISTIKGELRVSMKGPSAPSLAGGGLRGIEAIIPGIASRFLKKVYQTHIKRGLKKGQKVPDVYGKISDKDKLLLVVGNEKMGGPIDFMYIGPMEVKATELLNKGVLTVNGALIDSTEYANTHDLYFRLRARREDQTFDPKAQFKDGTPKIYSVSPSRGDSAGRLVVTDKPAQARDMISF